MSILEEMLEMFATTVPAELNATLRVCESGLQDVLTNRSDFTSNVVFQFLCPTGKNRTDLIQEILAVIRLSKLSGHQKSFRFRSCSHSKCGIWLHPAKIAVSELVIIKLIYTFFEDFQIASSIQSLVEENVLLNLSESGKEVSTCFS